MTFDGSSPVLLSCADYYDYEVCGSSLLNPERHHRVLGADGRQTGGLCVSLGRSWWVVILAHTIRVVHESTYRR